MEKGKCYTKGKRVCRSKVSNDFILRLILFPSPTFKKMNEGKSLDFLARILELLRFAELQTHATLRHASDCRKSRVALLLDRGGDDGSVRLRGASSCYLACRRAEAKSAVPIGIPGRREGNIRRL